jgi:hypothetical protein
MNESLLRIGGGDRSVINLLLETIVYKYSTQLK